MHAASQQLQHWRGDALLPRSVHSPVQTLPGHPHHLMSLPPCRYIDSRGENGLTALHLAAYSGSLECIRILLDAGASMMVRTVDLDMQTPVALPAGSTPLHAAAMNGHVAILQAMMQVCAAAWLGLHAVPGGL